MFSIICSYPSGMIPFPSGSHLSCPITVDIKRLSCQTRSFTLWHSSHYRRPRADIYRSLRLVVISEVLSYFLLTRCLGIHLPQITVSLPFSVCVSVPQSLLLSHELFFSLPCAVNPGNRQRHEDAVTGSRPRLNHRDFHAVFPVADKTLGKQFLLSRGARENKLCKYVHKSRR